MHYVKFNKIMHICHRTCNQNNYYVRTSNNICLPFFRMKHNRPWIHILFPEHNTQVRLILQTVHFNAIGCSVRPIQLLSIRINGKIIRHCTFIQFNYIRVGTILKSTSYGLGGTINPEDKMAVNVVIDRQDI